MDRRTFLTKSAALAASVAVAPQALAGAFASTKQTIEAPCKGWTRGMLFIRDLLSMGHYDPFEIAYCPATREQADFASSVLLPRSYKPHFETLETLIYKRMGAYLNFDARLMTPRDKSYFLTAMPDRARAEEMIKAHTHERMQATRREDLRLANRLINPSLPYFEGPNRDEVDCYACFRIKTGLFDQADLLSFGLTSMNPIKEISVAIIEGPDIQPLYLAAARKLLGEDHALFVYRG